MYTPDTLFSYFPAPSGEYGDALDDEPLLNAQIYINVPFKVKRIKVVNLTYTAGLDGTTGIEMEDGGIVTTQSERYVTVVSSLVGNRPVGMTYCNSQFTVDTTQNIVHTFQLPKIINGYYSFALYENDGVQKAPYTFGLSQLVAPPFTTIYYYFFDSFSITMEFDGEDEII
jgi:hypothetical protein